jgi:SAM-dependent methyltransferase
LTPKPAHLGPEYGEQFRDESVVRAYAARPPYPGELFEWLAALQRPARGLTGPILELGCGTGDLTFGLVGIADRLDAVEPSAAMLAAARRRAGADDRRIRWIEATAEAAAFEGPYALAVAAESLHWMAWDVVLPKVAAALAPGAVLAIVEREHVGPLPWDAELSRLIAAYSTNRAFRPYDLVAELTMRGLFREAGRRTTTPLAFSQSIADHVECMHSRNGFSRERMAADAAAAFDAAYRELLERYCADGVVALRTVATLVWGVPAAVTSRAAGLQSPS